MPFSKWARRCSGSALASSKPHTPVTTEAMRQRVVVDLMTHSSSYLQHSLYSCTHYSVIYSVSLFSLKTRFPLEFNPTRTLRTKNQKSSALSITPIQLSIFHFYNTKSHPCRTLLHHPMRMLQTPRNQKLAVGLHIIPTPPTSTYLRMASPPSIAAAWKTKLDPYPQVGFANTMRKRVTNTSSIPTPTRHDQYGTIPTTTNNTSPP